MSKTSALLGLVAATGLGFAACTEDQTTTTDDTTLATANIAMTLTPDPATAVASTDGEHDWKGNFNIEFVEDGGVGVTVSGVNVQLQESSGGIPLNTGQDPDVNVTMQAPASRIEANSTLTLGLTIDYTLPNGGREAIVAVQATLVDDNSHSGSFTASATVK